ncbi:Hypothetical protein D9617_22g067330 [Elsinoe fawcettii]|nr:Hypothetical protein D9617_22g067330 [Elsinoe fawcettii]
MRDTNMIYKNLIPTDKTYSLTSLRLPAICHTNRLLRKETLPLFMRSNTFVYECYTTRTRPEDLRLTLPLFHDMPTTGRPSPDCLSFLKIPSHILLHLKTILVIFVVSSVGVFFMLRISIRPPASETTTAEMSIKCCRTLPSEPNSTCALIERDFTHLSLELGEQKYLALSRPLPLESAGKSFLDRLLNNFLEDRVARYPNGGSEQLHLHSRDFFIICRHVYNFIGGEWCGGHVKTMLNLADSLCERPMVKKEFCQLYVGLTACDWDEEIEIVDFKSS